jgi:hypothetical protein
MKIGFPVSEIKKGSFSLANILEKIGAKSFEESGDDVIFILDNAEVKSNYNIWIETLKQEMPVNNGPTTSGKQTLYTFIVMGTTVYFFMVAGF